MKKIRCEGYRKYGNFMTLGPVRWEQCKEDAIVYLTVVQEDETATFPACMICWKESLSNSTIKVLEAKPIEGE